MQTNSLGSLIETLVQSIELETAAISQRHLRRQGQPPHGPRNALGPVVLDDCRRGEQRPQQACGEHC